MKNFCFLISVILLFAVMAIPFNTTAKDAKPPGREFIQPAALSNADLTIVLNQSAELNSYYAVNDVTIENTIEKNEAYKIISDEECLLLNRSLKPVAMLNSSLCYNEQAVNQVKNHDEPLLSECREVKTFYCENNAIGESLFHLKKPMQLRV